MTCSWYVIAPYVGPKIGSNSGVKNVIGLTPFLTSITSSRYCIGPGLNIETRIIKSSKLVGLKRLSIDFIPEDSNWNTESVCALE